MDKLTELSRDMARDDCKSINVKKNGKWKEFVAIVRCKDCRHRPIYDDWGDIVPPYSELKTNDYGETFYRNDYTCPFVSSDCVLSHMPKDDDFCSKGERKEDELVVADKD